jgi:hypothetical protein
MDKNFPSHFRCTVHYFSLEVFVGKICANYEDHSRVVFVLAQRERVLFEHYCEKNFKFLTAAHFKELNFAFVVDKTGIITELVDSTVDEFIESGILAMLYDRGFERYLARAENHIDEPLFVFSLGDLDVGFVVWLGACCVCVLVFFCELVSVTVKRLFKKWTKRVVGNLLFLGLLRGRLRGYY